MQYDQKGRVIHHSEEMCCRMNTVETDRGPCLIMSDVQELFLPSVYVVCRKVMFSVVSVSVILSVLSDLFKLAHLEKATRTWVNMLI